MVCTRSAPTGNTARARSTIRSRQQESRSGTVPASSNMNHWTASHHTAHTVGLSFDRCGFLLIGTYLGPLELRYFGAGHYSLPANIALFAIWQRRTDSRNPDPWARLYRSSPTIPYCAVLDYISTSVWCRLCWCLISTTEDIEAMAATVCIANMKNRKWSV